MIVPEPLLVALLLPAAALSVLVVLFSHLNGLRLVVLPGAAVSCCCPFRAFEGVEPILKSQKVLPRRLLPPGRPVRPAMVDDTERMRVAAATAMSPLQQPVILRKIKQRIHKADDC